MGIKERHERDREAVSRAILDAARELFVAEGFHNVSIRKIAERIEYSPAAIYGYFPSKDDIFFALAEEGFRLLGDPAAIRDDDRLKNAAPIERIRAAFWRMYEFSREQPQYFALMFVDRSVPRISQEYERFSFAREMKETLLDELRACIAAGELPATSTRSSRSGRSWSGCSASRSCSLSDRLGPDENAGSAGRRRPRPDYRRPSLRRDPAVSGRGRLPHATPTHC